MAYRGKTILGLFMPDELLYIGKSEDESHDTGIRGRILQHERDDHPVWNEKFSFKPGEEIKYCFAEVDPAWEHKIPAIEAALINVVKPRANTANTLTVGQDKKMEETIRIEGVAPALPQRINPAKEVTYSAK